MSKKCLIIDDVEVSRYVIGEAMSDLGYDISEAAEAKEALQTLQKSRFDVIVLDWHLRKTNALGLIPEIRKLPDAANTPIIICTGVELEKELKDIQGSGVQGFLKKPTNPAKVEAELKRIGLL